LDVSAQAFIHSPCPASCCAHRRLPKETTACGTSKRGTRATFILCKP
jgi:hypothetical protein